MPKERKKTSPIWKLDDDKFIELVKNSKSQTEILKYFNLSNKGGNFNTLKRRCKKLGIEYPKYVPNYSGIYNFHLRNKIPLESLFSINHHSRSCIKRRIIKENILDHSVCSICNMKNTWNNKEIVFILDHINGISNDNRLENLRFVCPNCNSQLSTHAGKRNSQKHNCIKCGKIISHKSKLCSKCHNSNDRKKSRRFDPTLNQLQNKIKELNGNMCAVGRYYGVSDNAVRKRIKRLISVGERKCNAMGRSRRMQINELPRRPYFRR